MLEVRVSVSVVSNHLGVLEVVTRACRGSAFWLVKGGVGARSAPAVKFYDSLSNRLLRGWQGHLDNQNDPLNTVQCRLF